MNSQEGPTSNFSLSKSIVLSVLKWQTSPVLSWKGRFCKIKVILPQTMNLKIWDLLNNKERRIDI